MVFTYPVILFLRFYRFESKKALRFLWAVLLAMCGVFFFTYLYIFVYLASVADGNRGDSIIAMLLFGGSIFVALVARVLHDMVFSLDRLVKERTEELERVYERALKTEKETQKLEDHFVFVAAHELRSPVTSMKWSMEMIREEGDDEKMNGGAVGEFMKRLEVSVDSLAVLVNDLLDTSRLEYGTIKLETGPCVMGDVIKDAIKEVEPLSVKEQVKLKVDLGEAEIREVIADCRRIREVLINLVSNSFKFTEAGGEVTVSLDVDDKDFTVSVSDTGVGLNEDDKSRLFQKFSKIDNHPQKKDLQSTGLGLYIAKTLVDLWGGRIWAESEGRGRGSAFRFTVPRFSN